MNDQAKSYPDWTVVLRRRPARIVERRAEGGYTDEYEIVCCDCGDDPGLDYREVSPALQRIRGPYPIAAGITAYIQHARRHPQAVGPPSDRRPARDGIGNCHTGMAVRRRAASTRWLMSPPAAGPGHRRSHYTG